MGPWLLVVVAGLGLLVVAGASYRLDRDDDLDELLGMAPVGSAPPAGPRSPAHRSELAAVSGRAVELAGRLAERVGRDRSLTLLVEQAHVPVRSGELLVIVACAAVATGALALMATGSTPLAAAAGAATPMVAAQVLRRRAARRRRAFEAQLPDALNLVASSLSAGHTFLRAVQMMCEESGPPLSEEFARLVAETRLGDPLVDSLDRMARRLQVRGLDIMAQAIRIQQTVGGRLADLLHTLSDTLRARDEVKREVQVLTAEGRLSAYVLAAMVPFLFVVIQVINPGYIAPLRHGVGLVVLGGCAASVVAGLVVILRMVRIDV